MGKKVGEGRKKESDVRKGRRRETDGKGESSSTNHSIHRSADVLQGGCYLTRNRWGKWRDRIKKLERQRDNYKEGRQGGGGVNDIQAIDLLAS